MSARYFTSDLHFGHTWVAGLRGFASVEEHDEHIVERWNSVVRKKDTVYVLGDLMVIGYIDVVLKKHVARLNGTKHLIAGNHDSVHPMHRRAGEAQKMYLTQFASVQAYAKLRVDKQDVLLSHFPYLTGEAESQDHTPVARYTQWRLPDEGKWLLHGHTHSSTQRLHDGHQVHIGWDAWGEPVHESTVRDIIREQAAAALAAPPKISLYGVEVADPTSPRARTALSRLAQAGGEEVFFVSFGVQYNHERHPVSPRITGTVIGVVAAPDHHTARERVERHLGDKWSFLYPEGDIAPEVLDEHFPDGIAFVIDEHGIHGLN